MTTSTFTAATAGQAVNRTLAAWLSGRAALAELERAEHPDITDRLGRTWTWRGGDLFRHCGNVAPAHMIDQFGIPSQRVLDNPNYGHLCDLCLGGRERNVPDCRPEWNCSHVMHQEPNNPLPLNGEAA